MMPPHITDTHPAAGGVLHGHTVRVRGYTFGLTDDVARIVDSAGAEVETVCERGGDWQGTGNQPGARQHRSTLAIRFVNPPTTGLYTLHFLDERVVFEVLQHSMGEAAPGS